MWHAWGRREGRRKFYLGSLKERDHSEDISIDGRIVLKCILRK
jgi:hypothetical protein